MSKTQKEKAKDSLDHASPFLLEHTFTIKGNPEDPLGNPLPKLHTTRNQFWTPKARRYVDWKMFVTRSFLNSLSTPVNNQVVNQFVDVRPITIPDGRKAYMEIMIYFKNNVRPDPENTFGSIADALFANDKYLAGTFDFAFEPTGEGYVDITIKV